MSREVSEWMSSSLWYQTYRDWLVNNRVLIISIKTCTFWTIKWSHDIQLVTFAIFHLHTVFAQMIRTPFFIILSINNIIILTSLVSKWRRHPSAFLDMFLISIERVEVIVSKNLFCWVYHPLRNKEFYCNYHHDNIGIYIILDKNCCALFMISKKYSGTQPTNIIITFLLTNHSWK